MSDSPFKDITDPVLKAKLEEIYQAHVKVEGESRPEVAGKPRYVFSRATNQRGAGAMVRVRNGLDEETRGGTIIRPIGRAFLVDVRGQELIVHEADDSWD